MKNLIQRTITGVIFVAVLIGATIFHPNSLFALFFTISNLALFEFYTITKNDATNTNIWGGILFNSLIQIIGFSISSDFISASAMALLLPVILILTAIELYRKKELPFNGLAYMLFGIAYISIPFTLVYPIALQSGFGQFMPGLIVALLVFVWTNDTGAYLTGMAFGRTKLFERISPKKTWEGAIGGTALTTGAGYLIWLNIPEIALHHWLAIAVIVSISANFGDLVESLLKRSIGVKDSGSILPGHGGMLDRFDGVIFAIPAFFSYLQLF